MISQLKSKLSVVFIALLCTITLCIPTTIFSFATDSTAVISQTASGFQNFAHTATNRDGQFTDVNPTDWFSNDVKSAFEIGMMIGDSDTTFNPSIPWFQSYVNYDMDQGILDAAIGI